MDGGQVLAAFENYRIRRTYDEASQTWYFSVVDIVAALIQQPDYQAARNYWKVLKSRLMKEGSESVTKCNRLLKTQNLRDHMSEAELIFTALAEMSTRQIAETVQATGVPENAEAGRKGGGIARKARLELEQKTGRSVVTGENFLPPASTRKKLEDRT